MIIGLTGGIGSGKSTVGSMFKELGVPVYVADTEARKLMASSEAIRLAIIKAFGEKSYRDRVPDTKFLSAIVFKDEEKLQQLNAIIHPRVKQHFLDWYKQQKAVYVIKEVAILFESGGHNDCDKIITVTAPTAVRIQRVMQRDGVSEAMVLDRIKHQWPDEKKMALSDFVINNIHIEEVTKIVKKIHNDLMENHSE